MKIQCPLCGHSFEDETESLKWIKGNVVCIHCGHRFIPQGAERSLSPSGQISSIELSLIVFFTILSLLVAAFAYLGLMFYGGDPIFAFLSSVVCLTGFYYLALKKPGIGKLIAYILFFSSITLLSVLINHEDAWAYDRRIAFIYNLAALIFSVLLALISIVALVCAKKFEKINELKIKADNND